MTSELINYINAALVFGLLGLMAYDALPNTPRKYSDAIRRYSSPVTLIIYLLVVLGAGLDFFQTVAR